MKHYKDIIIHGAQLYRHLKGQQGYNSNELALAKLPLAASRTAARALSRRVAAGEDEDDFFSSFASGSGKDKSGDGDFDMLSAFAGAFGGGEGEESGGDFDFLSAFGGGLGGGEDEESLGGDFFSNLLAGFGGEDGDMDDKVMENMDEVMENMEQCGIDVADMETKALGAFLMSGASMDFSSPESFGAFAPILLALKDDDEVDCTEYDLAKLVSASEEYLQCSGTNVFFDPKDTEEYAALIQSIEDECKPIMDLVISGDILSLEEEDILDEESELGKSGKRCLQTLLGDNEMGNFIRYQYNHMDEIFGCFTKLGENIPHCVISIPTLEDGTTYSFPLSLEKKLSCVLGSSSASVIEAACVGTYETLDKCLPQSDATDVDGMTSLCAEEEGLFLGKQDTILGMDASIVTGNKMPGFCSKVFEEKGMDTKDLQSRLEHYHENREYGWTLASTANGAKVEVEAAPESPEVEEEEESPQAVPSVSMKASEQPQEMYKSVPIDISSVESSEWTDGEAAPTASDHASSKSKFFPFLLGGLFIVGSVVLALVVKYARGALGMSPLTSKSSSNSNTLMKEYAHVAVKLDGHDFA
mmetsp:Transcript_15170/g.32929  ORF Transcript_15170/g.32929 Transcript_15170/m.32929 type:complete len:586 (-) Transcript_15170:79-1836(-)